MVNATHITASFLINDDEPGLHADYQKWLERLATFEASPQTHQRNRTDEDNATAHLKRLGMDSDPAARGRSDATIRVAC